MERIDSARPEAAIAFGASLPVGFGNDFAGTADDVTAIEQVREAVAFSATRHARAKVVVAL